MKRVVIIVEPVPRKADAEIHDLGFRWQWRRRGEPGSVKYAMRKNVAVARAIAEAEKETRAQVVIFTRDHKIQEERTFPRSSDPRRSRG